MNTAQINNSFSLVAQAHQGIDISYFDNLLQKTGIPKNTLAAWVGIDTKTVDNYRKGNKKFDVLEGELLLKLSHLFEVGEEVLGNSDEFRTWLTFPAIGLNHQKPMDLLNTSTGADLVKEELLRIAHGYVA